MVGNKPFFKIQHDDPVINRIQDNIQVALKANAQTQQSGQGLQGSPGVTGPAGGAATGPTGPMGPVGPAGPPGAAGAVGATGSIGPQGIPGVTGPTGPQGIPGVTGPAGPTGSIGATGVQGPTGPAGNARDLAGDANTLHCWNLDEASGATFVDSGTAGITGTIIKVGTGFQYQSVGGGPNLGLAFNAVTKMYLTGATGAANRPSGNNITVHGWFRHRDVTATQQYVHRKYTGSGGTWSTPFLSIGFADSTSNKVQFYITTGTNGSGTLTTVTPDTVLGVGIVYHFACTYDGTTFLGYINGEQVSSNILSANIDWNTTVEGPWVIGGVDSISGDNRFIGVARRVRVESVALSKASIQAIYNAGIGSA